jgi:chromate transport protein ChrA
MILLKLFLVFLRVGFFAIGGAYFFLPLLERELVQNHQWLNKPEFMEVVGMAEISPDAILLLLSSVPVHMAQCSDNEPQTRSYKKNYE